MDVFQNLLPEPNGKQTIQAKTIRVEKKTEVVVMDLVPVQADVVEFVKAGVSDFILKDADLDDFMHTIRSVAQGAKVLPYFIV